MKRQKKIVRKMKYKTTSEMRNNHEYVSELQIFFAETNKSKSFWAKKTYSIDDKLRLLKEIARAKNILWESIYREYPESISKTLVFDNKFIQEQ